MIPLIIIVLNKVVLQIVAGLPSSLYHEATLNTPLEVDPSIKENEYTVPPQKSPLMPKMTPLSYW